MNDFVSASASSKRSALASDFDLLDQRDRCATQCDLRLPRTFASAALPSHTSLPFPITIPGITLHNTMTLLTPPHTRLDKENRRVARSKTTHVAWSQVNEYHSVTSPPCTRKVAASASKVLPRRSILKQTSYLILPLLFPENEREATPEPSSPLSDLHYLDSPVNKILAPRSTLPDLIEAYSVLTARLRAAVNESTDSDCSWPLFQPLRKRRVEFVDAVVRDLGRALIDPMEGSDQPGCLVPEPLSPLPSPEKSPRKKRCDMDEEQVKYARDLATVSHTAIKLLGLVFTLPAVYNLFDGSFAKFHSRVSDPLTLMRI
jgi:hypothetical protein